MGEVWFTIPSASVERCRERLPVWREMGYRIAVLQNVERGKIPADRVLWRDAYPGWAESINILCREVVPASASIVVSGGDDMLPDPDRSADELAADFHERFPDGFGVMQPAGDRFMWSEHYCGSPWIGRAFFERMYHGRGPMFGGYRHNWADYELYWVARCLGALWMREDVTQYHAHFSRADEEAPAWWRANVGSAERADCQLFIARKSCYFPGHEPISGAPVFDRSELDRAETGAAEWSMSKLAATESFTQPVAERVSAALGSLAADGMTSVALYGAGTHTRKAAHALATPPVRIAAIIDDDPSRHGGQLWGFPIIGLSGFAASGAEAIVLSSDSFEDKLWAATEGLRDRGVRVVRLYDDERQDGEQAA